MPDEVVEQTVTTTEGGNQAPDLSTQLQQAAWEGKTFEQGQAQQQNNANGEPLKPEQKKEEEEILDPVDWLKREFNVDSVDAIKQEREELTRLREAAKTPSEIKYANERSKLFHEALVAGEEDKVYDYLHQKKRLEKLTNPDVTKLSAEDIIKYGIKHKNNNLSDDDVNFLFQKKFSFPSKPTQEDTELPEDYAAKIAKWEEQVQAIERELIIEAKMTLPELEKLKTQLVLPEIPKQETPKTEPSPEDAAKAAQFKENFLKSAQSSISNFNGFEIPVKDKDVDYKVNYATSQEEKDFVSKQIQSFADNNYNVNAILADRWVNEDGTLKTDQMTKDLSMLYFGEKALNKIGIDSAGKRLEEYLKGKKNINLNETRQVGEFTPEGDKTEAQKIQEHFWNN